MEEGGLVEYLRYHAYEVVVMSINACKWQLVMSIHLLSLRLLLFSLISVSLAIRYKISKLMLQ